MNSRIGGLLWLLLILVAACKPGDRQVFHKNVTGKAGEMIVVMSKVAWDDVPGNLVRKTLAQPQLALPQEEPLFDLISVPHEAFKDIFLTTRNILQTKISPIVENPGVTYANDVWAYPQATVQINARNNEEFDKIFSENSDKIVAYFLKAERNRLAENYRKLYEKSVYNNLEAKFNIKLTVPPGFQISTEKENFSWIRYETPEISQGLLVYTLPYTSDSIFTLHYLLHKRDSILRANVPGPTEGSYMTTERIAAPIFNVTSHNGNYAADIRGLWRVENDFMGGPFLMLAELDAHRQRVVVVDGYVYAPSKNKRNYTRQIEAILYSLQFNDQEKNDKINSQINMGN
ncbi:MAG TPA: DUF4837 family protein [Prolixibacteraceae bacterium]|nr:DUF4837 family protein [Bacteroidales bacterium]HNQ38277.1 DUF4837 family protein [Prolixibacteraceae bacterium]